MTDEKDPKGHLAALIQELKSLKQNLPAHSLKPSLLIRIEELEEQIESIQRQDLNQANKSNIPT